MRRLIATFVAAAAGLFVMAPNALGFPPHDATPMGEDFVWGRIAHPGQAHWYSFYGKTTIWMQSRGNSASTDDSEDTTPRSCVGHWSLRVEFWAAEGRLLHAYRVSDRGTTSVRVLVPDRYYLRVRAIRPGCSGLWFGLLASPEGSGGDWASEGYSAGQFQRIECQAAQDWRVRVEQTIHRERRRVAHTRGKMRRKHERVLRRYLLSLPKAKQDERDACE